MKVLFVCRGNVGRSQVAEALYNQIYPNGSDSAGTVVDKENQKVGDREAAKNIIDAMKEKGVDISDKRSNQLTPTMLEGYDKVVVMAEPKNIPDYLKNSPKFEYWEVKDAKGVDLETARGIRDHIHNLILEMNK